MKQATESDSLEIIQNLSIKYRIKPETVLVNLN